MTKEQGEALVTYIDLSVISLAVSIAAPGKPELLDEANDKRMEALTRLLELLP